MKKRSQQTIQSKTPRRTPSRLAKARLIERIKEEMRVDLRLECRAQRLTEYPEWSPSELDLIEREASCYGDQANLTQVASGTVEPTPFNEDYSWLHSPSPFAWT